jgi:hypothetical protein
MVEKITYDMAWIIFAIFFVLLFTNVLEVDSVVVSTGLLAFAFFILIRIRNSWCD